jgi:hypothetical protein
MPIFRRELFFEPQSATAETGDWWHLVLDTDAPGLYIEHTWKRARPHEGGETSAAQRFGINDMLSLAESRPAQAALISALSELFREAGAK